MRTLLAVLILLLPSVATAAEFTLPDGSRVQTIDPPAKWLNAPYSGTIDIAEKSPDHVIKACSASLGRFEEFGCAWITPHFCAILIADNMPPALRENILAHELAHCRGWGPDHSMD